MEMEMEMEQNNYWANENLHNAKSEQERFTFLLSHMSPASALKITAMNLAGSNTSMKNRYEDQTPAYPETYTS